MGSPPYSPGLHELSISNQTQHCSYLLDSDDARSPASPLSSLQGWQVLGEGEEEEDLCLDLDFPFGMFTPHRVLSVGSDSTDCSSVLNHKKENNISKKMESINYNYVHVSYV